MSYDQTAADALREIANLKARIAELEAREGKRERLIAALVRAVEHSTANAVMQAAYDLAEYEGEKGELTVAVAFHRTNCPECDEDPEESIGLCPYHKAEALLQSGHG